MLYGVFGPNVASAGNVSADGDRTGSYHTPRLTFCPGQMSTPTTQKCAVFLALRATRRSFGLQFPLAEFP